MSGYEIFGIIAGAISLFDVAGKVVSRFRNNSQIAPESVWRLHSLLKRLRDENVRFLAEESELEEIKSLARRCQNLLERYDPPGDAARGPLSYKWPATAETQLMKWVIEIEGELSNLHLLMSMRRPSLGKLEKTSAKEHVPQSGPPVTSTDTRDQADSAASIQLLPTKLYLEDKNGDYLLDHPTEFLSLQKVNIADRDQISRTLQYENDDGTIIVSHRIRRSKLPFVEDELEAIVVDFNEPQEIIVKMGQNYSVYRANASYVFSKAEDLDLFIEEVRERKLIGKFLPDKILDNGKLAARFVIIRLWQRARKAEHGSVLLQPIITMTYHNRRSGKQIEINLEDYRNPPAFSKESQIDIWATNGQDKLSFLFSDRKDAIKFKEKITECHPQSSSRFTRLSIDLPLNQPLFPNPLGTEPSTNANSAAGSSTTSSVAPSSMRAASIRTAYTSNTEDNYHT